MAEGVSFHIVPMLSALLNPKLELQWPESGLNNSRRMWDANLPAKVSLPICRNQWHKVQITALKLGITNGQNPEHRGSQGSQTLRLHCTKVIS